jgi:hypothetical protein
MFNTKCHNYAGKVVVANPVVSGTIRQVILQVPQVSLIGQAKWQLRAISVHIP